jgi:hypothetical protein
MSFFPPEIYPKRLRAVLGKNGKGGGDEWSVDKGVSAVVFEVRPGGLVPVVCQPDDPPFGQGKDVAGQVAAGAGAPGNEHLIFKTALDFKYCGLAARNGLCGA